MGTLKYLDTQKRFNVPPVEEVMKVSQEAALRGPQEGGEQQVRGGRGKAHHRLKSPPYTCYPVAPLLTHGAGVHPKGRKSRLYCTQ